METIFCSCGKESSGNMLVYIVDNDNDLGYCSKECINKHFRNTEDISIKQMTAKKALDDNFFLDTGDIVIADSTCFLVVETVNDYVLVDLSKGKVDLDNFETPAEIQTDLDRRYGNDNYQIIKKANVISLLNKYNKTDEIAVTPKEALTGKKEVENEQVKTIGSLDDFNKFIDHLDND